jgi:hypothetical protein
VLLLSQKQIKKKRKEKIFSQSISNQSPCELFANYKTIGAKNN